MPSSYAPSAVIRTFAFALMCSAFSLQAAAQSVTDIAGRKTDGANGTESAYAQDARGNVLRSEFGLCWRSGDWNPKDAMLGCDGPLVPPVQKATAPAVVSAVPQPAPSAPSGLTPVLSDAAAKRCDFAVTLGSDQTFVRSKAASKVMLSIAAKKRIDEEVISRLGNCATVQSLRVIGHTDRIGNETHNFKLSEQQAGAVADYLQAKGTTMKPEIVGAGEENPIKSCDGKHARSQLSECLAPNRRIAIEARGIAR